MPPDTDYDLENQGEAVPFRQSVRRMFAILIRPEMVRWRFRIAMAILFTIVAKGFSVSAPVFMGEGINALTGGAPVDDSKGVARLFSDVDLSFVVLFLLFAAVRFMSSALPVIRDAFFSAVTQDAQRLISVDTFRHAQHLDLQFHLTRRSGALNRVIERGAGAMDYLIRFLAFNIGPTIIELAFAAVVLGLLYGIQFSIAAIVTVAIYAGFTIIVTEWRNKQRRAMNAADTRLRGISLDTMANFETVKSFAAEDREAHRFDGAMRVYNQHYIKVMKSLAFLNGGQEFIMTGGLLAVAILAGHGALNGTMQVGDVTAIILMLFNIYRPLNILGWAWREIKQGAVDIEKLFALLDRKSLVPDAPDAVELKVDHGAIRFSNISFAHEGRASGLNNISFDIPGGAFVGIVGASGTGKSTILKLLFRFYDAQSGEISIDGQNIKTLTQHSLRSSLGVVPQEVVLFNDTLRFNLAYAVLDASDEMIMSAVSKAQLNEFIDSLPDGLDTRVGERGLKLSGGEKQRVGVARAILRDPLILILDEATSSLDSGTEEEVQNALQEASRGRTTLAVAHRLSTVADADFILVLDNGAIVESGSHDDLVAAEGVYAHLWHRQSGGEHHPAFPSSVLTTAQ